MAECAVTFFLQKLDKQLSQEARLLRGVKNEVTSIKRELVSMKAFLEDADQKRWRDKSLDAWVEDVRLLVFTVEDIVDEFIAQKERNNPSGGIMRFLTYHAYFFKDLKARHGVGSQIRKIKEDIIEVDKRRKRYKLKITQGGVSGSDESERGPRVGYPFFEEADIVGIDSDTEEIKKWLFKEEEERRRSVISVVGMGGSGKTTLVKKIYNNVKYEFDCHSWVSVSQSYQTRELLNEIARGFQLGTETVPGDQLIEKMYTFLQGRKLILVLDDIWDAGVWETLKQAFPVNGGGKIIFTTRIGDVARPTDEISYVHEIQPLTHDLSWGLFCKKAFLNSNPRGVCPPELKDLGEGLVKRCKGLPLAVVAIGGLLSKKGTNPSQWREILHNLDLELIENPNLESLNKLLLLSYNYLPFYLRYCFLYCALFPEDYEIERKKLTLLWVAEGFIHDCSHKTKTAEEVADSYFMELIDRNMLQVADIEAGKILSCKVHDLMRDLAIDISVKENFGAICCGKEDNKVEGSSRRLSIHGDGDNIPTNVGKLRFRSFLVFGIHDLPSALKRTLPSNLTLLSVLDLQGVKITNLPAAVCEMIHLRYLGLRETWVELLPCSIGKLRKLQTLDLGKTRVACLPPSINMLHQLRHLFLIDWVLCWYPTEGSVNVPPLGSGNLRCLQILMGVDATPSIVRELGSFTQLRTLYVKEVTEGVSQELCASVKKMKCLRSLIIKQKNDRVIQFETLSPPPLYLEELIFVVRMERLPEWVGALNCLTVLLLYYCNLIEDPLSALQHLPNLLLLKLQYSYQGKKIAGCDPTGFPKLRTLSLLILTEVEELGRIEEGAMPCLEHVEISGCGKLKMLPQGFQHLTSLKRLELQDIAEEFLRRLRVDGEDHGKVQHIPKITYNGRPLRMNVKMRNFKMFTSTWTTPFLPSLPCPKFNP